MGTVLLLLHNVLDHRCVLLLPAVAGVTRWRLVETDFGSDAALIRANLHIVLWMGVLRLNEYLGPTLLIDYRLLHCAG